MMDAFFVARQATCKDIQLPFSTDQSINMLIWDFRSKWLRQTSLKITNDFLTLEQTAPPAIPITTVTVIQKQNSTFLVRIFNMFPAIKLKLHQAQLF